MTRDQAVDIIMQRLGNRKDAALKDFIISEMVLVQETILEGGEVMPWFLLTETASTSTTASEERVHVPTDFLMEWEEGALYIVNTDSTESEVIKDDYDAIKAAYPDTGQPKRYDTAGYYFLLRPVPDDAYTLKIKYYARDTSLSGVYGDAANIENEWLKHASDWFIGEVGSVVASQYLQNEKLAQRFDVQSIRGKNRIIARNTAMQEANKDRNMGDQ